MIHVNKAADYNTLGKETVRRLSFSSSEKLKNKNHPWVFQECRRADQPSGSWNTSVPVFNIPPKCNHAKPLEGIVLSFTGV